jgi:hypothetical protein
MLLFQFFRETLATLNVFGWRSGGKGGYRQSRTILRPHGLHLSLPVSKPFLYSSYGRGHSIYVQCMWRTRAALEGIVPRLPGIRRTSVSPKHCPCLPSLSTTSNLQATNKYSYNPDFFSKNTQQQSQWPALLKLSLPLPRVLVALTPAPSWPSRLLLRDLVVLTPVSFSHGLMSARVLVALTPALLCKSIFT